MNESTGSIALGQCSESTEMAQQDDIAVGFTTRQQQLLSIGRPVKIEDMARAKFGELLWLAARHGLFP
jgi:hypothetical protein